MRRLVLYVIAGLSCIIFVTSIVGQPRKKPNPALKKSVPPKPKTSESSAQVTKPVQPDPPTPNTTRLHLTVSGYTGVLTTEPPQISAGVCLSNMLWTRTLTGDMKGTAYKFNLSMDTLRNAPSGTFKAEIIIKRGASENLVASTTFTAGPKSEIKKVVLTGTDPDAAAGDKLIFRTQWVDGQSCVSTDTDGNSFIEIPETPITENEYDLPNKSFLLTGTVVNKRGLPMAGKTILVSPVNQNGEALTVFDVSSPKMLNPTAKSDAKGQFTVKVYQGLFMRGGNSSEGKVEIVEDIGGGSVRKIGEGVKFKPVAGQPKIEVGKITFAPN